jgi:hypothetical protein
MFFERVQLRRAGRQEDRGDVAGDVALGGGVRAGAVEQQNGVGALGDVARDFLEIELHGLVVSAKGNASAAATPRAGQMAPKR